MKTQVKLIRTIEVSINKRSMFLVKNVANKPTNVTSFFKGNFPHRTYATFSCNKPDLNPIDQQANVNNPPGANGKSHAEIHRTTCTTTNTYCKAQNCGPTTTCESIKSREAVAHMTSGNPQINHGTVETLDANTNILKQNKAQHMVVYHIPHKVITTPEAFPIQGKPTGAGTGTDFIQEPNHIQTIIDKTKYS